MYVYLNDLFSLLDEILPKTAPTAKPQPKNNVIRQPKVFETWICPKIQRVTFNGDTTIVFFNDNTHVVMKCSPGDKYDRKTAIVYAIVKRMLGKVGKIGKDGKLHANEVDGNGFGCYLQKIVDSAFDQEKEEKLAAEKKHHAKANHIAKQEAEKQAAFERRVNERAKEILLERAAIDRANEVEDNTRTNGSPKASYSTTTEYVRPDKPFSKFTQAEKRAYWRAHNAKRKK